MKFSLQVCFGMVVLFTASLTMNANASLIGQLGVLDPAIANGGINPATGLAWAQGDTYRLVFITSTSRDATSTNIADYNSFVQGVANTAGLGSVTWTAIGSTATVDARDNTNTNPISTGIAIFNFNNQKIADNNADLWDGSIDTAIAYTELGIQITANPYRVWTGSTAAGIGQTLNGGDQLGTGDSEAQWGGGTDSSSIWAARFVANPSTAYPFYAISDTLQIVPEPSSLVLLGLGSLLLASRRRG